VSVSDVLCISEKKQDRDLLITCERYAVTFSLSSHLTGEKSLGDPACYCHSATQEQHAVLSLAWTMENTQEPAYAQGTLATAPAGTATAAGLAGRLSESSCKKQLSTDAGSRPEACSSPGRQQGPRPVWLLCSPVSSIEDTGATARDGDGLVSTHTLRSVPVPSYPTVARSFS
jgi:hypothetical protein